MEKTEELEKVYSKLESGDISVSDAIKESSKLTAEIARTQARDAVEQRTQEIFSNRDIQTATSKFYQDYPDYTEVLESGKLQPYIDRNPLLIDQALAYFQYKADQRAETTKTEINVPKEPEKAKGFLKHGDQIEAEQLRTLDGIRDKRPARKEPFASEEEIETHQLETICKMRGE